MMKPALRKFMLTSHITFAVGWFGAVAAFLALAVAGLFSEDANIIRSSYVSMELIGWLVIVPFFLVTLFPGIFHSATTPCGFFNDYWVAVMLILTVISTLVLFLHMKPISYLGEMALKQTFSASELRGLRIQLIADAGAALLVLLATTAISVYKPWGLTSFGQQKLQITAKRSKRKQPRIFYILISLVGILILLFLLAHLFRGH